MDAIGGNSTFNKDNVCLELSTEHNTGLDMDAFRLTSRSRSTSGRPRCKACREPGITYMHAARLREDKFPSQGIMSGRSLSSPALNKSVTPGRFIDGSPEVLGLKTY
jgi:hypothetical protein